MKNIIITGCAKGLGLETSIDLAKAGYKVLGISRTPTEEYNTLLSKYPNSVFFYQFDFENIGLISDLVKSITKAHGRIFGLINNAAIGHDGVLATMHETDISTLLKVNVEAPIILTKYISS